MGFNDHTCNTGLVLGLGFSSSTARSTPPSSTAVPLPEKPHPTADHPFEPSLTLALSVPEKTVNNNNHSDSNSYKAAAAAAGTCELEANGADHFFRQASPLYSGVSSFSSGGRVVVKRERDLSSEETEVDKINSFSRVSDEDDDGVNTRKKLRLTKDQSALLEESFKQQSTLNPKQKQALARQLNLRPRQVEVWFQNRRARTKLKQTEVDCEFLKKCCETLTDENRRLQKEVQELKALKMAQPFYMHMPAATLTMCPSCERIGAAADGGGNSNKSQFSMSPNKVPPHHFLISPFTNPSAAC